MAVDGKGLAITFGIYAAVALVVFALFSWWRNRALTKKFYAPKRFIREKGHQRPPAIEPGFGTWIKQTLGYSEAEVIRVAGVDAAMYLKILRMGIELFAILTVVCSIIMYPVNCTGGEVAKLIDQPPLTQNDLGLWWVSPAPPPPPGGGGDSTPAETTQSAPKMYKSSIPPAPPGLIWWEYLNDTVPPLPPAPPNMGWQYDDKYQLQSYTFSAIDKTSLSNVPSRDARLYAYSIMAYVVTFICFWLWWRYNLEALRLRTFYLLHSPAGAETLTVLVTDVPGVAHGMIPQRLGGSFLMKLLPKAVKQAAFKRLLQAQAAAGQTEEAAATAAESGKLAASSGIKAEQEESEVVAGEALAGSEGGKGGKLSKGTAGTQSYISPLPHAVSGRWEMPDAWNIACDKLAAGQSIESVCDEQFREVYGASYSHTHMVYNTATLDGLVGQYTALKGTAEDLLDDLISKKRRGKQLKPLQTRVFGIKMGAWGNEKYGAKPVKVNTFEFYKDRLNFLKSEIDKEAEGAKASSYPTAFVTFRTHGSQVAAARSLMCEDLSAWLVQQAPAPREVVWGNLGLRVWERAGRTTLMGVCFWLLACFFLIPVTMVQGILTTNSLVGFLQDIPILNSVITGILPGLALAIFLAFVPPILTAMARFSGMVSDSQIDLSVVSRFFTFQVITTVLGTIVAGSFFNQLQQFIDDPSSAVTILATAAPQTALFFMTYIMLQALAKTPLSLMRLVSLVIFWIKSKLAGTERAKERCWKNQEMKYGTMIAPDTIAILLGVLYSCISPLILPFVLLYFLTAYLVWKYQVMYVYSQPYQAGGTIWMRVFDQLVVGLLVFQVITIALLGLKETIAPPIIVVPLLFFTLAYRSAVHARFWRPQETLSMIAAAELDRRNRQLKGSTTLAAADLDAEVAAQYVSPSFKVSAEEHAALVDQCARMDAVLGGGTDEELFAEETPAGGDLEEGSRSQREEAGGSGYATPGTAAGSGYATPLSAAGSAAGGPKPEALASAIKGGASERKEV